MPRLRTHRARSLLVGAVSGATALVVLAFPPVGANAAGTVGAGTVPSTVAVPGPAGSVEVTTNPYRLTVRDTAGRVRLREVPNSPVGPTPYVGLDPAALGGDVAAAKPLVSPLVLTVGAAIRTTFPALFWSGNLLTGVTTGVQYRATRVTAVARDATSGATTLEVASNSPTGQTFRVTIRPTSSSFDIDASVRGPALGQAGLLTHSFAAPSGEAFHGFGGRHESTDLRGTSFYSWTEQENFGAGPLTGPVASLPGTGGDGYMFPNGPSAAYYVQPQFISNHYGFLADQYDLLRWRMAPGNTPNAWQVTSTSSRLREVVVPFDPARAIAVLTARAGRQQVPPAWALRPQIDRLVYTQDTASSYLSTVEADIERFRSGTLRPAAYRVEGWGILAPDDLRHVLAELEALGIHPLAYFRSFVSLDTAATEKPEIFATALANGYGATTALGTPYITGGTFGGPALVIDFTNPRARTWFTDRLTAALNAGFDGFMTDFGEQVQPDMHFADGETGATMHNRYATVYQQVVDAAVTRYRESHPGRSVFRYNRAGYLGSARYEVANFPGDETTDWGAASGLASQTPDMLNRAVGGAYGFTTDIGGYEDHLTGATSAELLLRWAEWAVFSPVFRLHGSASQGTHMPWNYDAQTLATYEKLTALRERVAPLIGRLWAHARATGMPITTPLWLAYPGDAAAARQDQEWMLGTDLLVAPVVTEGATSRAAYLPSGCWTYQPSGAQYSGARTVTVAAPLGTVPWFTHCGTDPLGG